VLGVAGLVVAWRRAPVERFFGVWLLLFTPFVVLGGLLDDLGVFTARRGWLFAAVPLVVCAAMGAAALLRRVPLVPGAAVLAVVVLVPSTVEVLHTRDVIDGWHRPPHSTNGSDQWEPTLSMLRSETRGARGMVVLAPDNDAAFAWQHSGAQPFSLLVSGSTKLGYDPATLTRWGYLERVRMQRRAFQRGLTGLCALARRVGADRVVLRRTAGMLGVHDLRPSSPYRVDPEDRTRATIRRRVGPGLTYLDLNSTEALQIDGGARLGLGWSSPSTTMVKVDLLRPASPAAVTLVTPDGRVLHPGGDGITRPRRGVARSSFRFAVDGIAPGTVLRPTRRVAVTRLVGYERVPSIPVTPGTGTVDLPSAAVCQP
jgi:hypothetical protein